MAASRLSALCVALAAALASASAPAAEPCAPAPDYLATAPDDAIGGIGGTGHGGDGGIGGTGRAPGDRDGGLGGTGIVGTVTGFASVCVNGVEVHYDATVPVAENGRPSSARTLAFGQVVAIDAGAGPRGLAARRIDIVHALEGPVTAVTADRLEVMGVPVVAAYAGVAPVRAGEWVQVSGHRDAAGRWVATRLAAIAARGDASVQGSVDAPDRVAGVRISTADQAPGAQRLLRGTWEDGPEGGRLRVRESVAAPASALIERSERLIVETRVRAATGRIGTGLPEIDGAIAGRAVAEGELVRLRARRGADGGLVVERFERERARGAAERPGSGKRDDEKRGRDAEKARPDGDRGDSGKSDKGEKIDKMDNSGKGDAGRSGRERGERLERGDRTERERIDKTERSDRSGRD